MARWCALAVLVASGAWAQPEVHGRCFPESAWRSQHLWNFSSAFVRCGPSTVCSEGRLCQNLCTIDEECDDFPMRICAGQGGGSASCKHKDLFGQGAERDMGAAVAFFIISGLALSAGIGGGGLYVPLLMLLLGFSSHEATGLSQALLAGGASSTLIYNMRQRHPSGSKPMIDYDLVLVMGPNLLIGVFVGSSLNIAAPSWLILMLIITVLGHSGWKTTQKALVTLRRERAGEVRGRVSSDGRLSKNIIERAISRARKAFGRHSRLDEPGPCSTPHCSKNAVISWSPNGGLKQSTGSLPQTTRSDAVKDVTPQFVAAAPQDVEAASPDGGARAAATARDLVIAMGSSPGSPWGQLDRSPCEQLDSVQEEADPHGVIASEAKQRSVNVEDQIQFPVMQITQFAFMWLISLICITVRGGRASPGLVPYCGQTYWVLTAFTVVALALLSLLGAQRAVERAGDASLDHDFHWTKATAQKVAMCSLAAGTLAALCGIGGGMVMGPILLDIGVLPQVQSATTATTLLALSSSSALAFLVQGAAPVDYALFLAAFTAIGAVCGKALTGFLVKLYRRPSAIIFLLGGVILASVVIMTITGTIDVINDIRQGHGLGFESICTMDNR